MTDAVITCSEHFTELALNELRRFHKKLECIQNISPQHLYIRNEGSFGNLVRPWQHKIPIYLHHIFPIHRLVSLVGTPEDFISLRQAAKELCTDDFTVQTRIVGDYRYATMSVNHGIQPSQNTALTTPPQGRIISILITGRTAYMGISWASQNLSPFAGGMQYFDEPVPNRAGFKLLEFLSTFDIHFRRGTKALDLGAAPGAWTELLRRREVYVTAVAPNDMYDWLRVDPHVEAFHMTAEDYLEQCNTVYDVLLNDMKLDPQDSAKLMVDFAQYLRSDGIAIMTLKLRMRHPRRVMDHAFRLLRKAYKIINIRQLVHNKKEVTLYLRRQS